MRQKIIVFLACALLAGCGSVHTGRPRSLWGDTPPSALSGALAQPAEKVALLLPLSGASADLGDSFRNAGMMALFENPRAPVELFFFDTRGTTAGAKQAYEDALTQGPALIIGPVFAPEVRAVKDEGPSVPVLSFTSDGALMERGIYTLGLLIPDQVNRIVRFACEGGQRRLAVLGPKNKTGELTTAALERSIARCPGMSLAQVVLYEPNTGNFDPTVRPFVPTPVIDPKKKDLTPEEELILATPLAERLSFDALLIFEEGVKLRQVVSLLSFYDITPQVVPFYGLSPWQSVSDASLRGSHFPAMPQERWNRFQARYKGYFGTDPVRLASLAYDAVSLSADLAARGQLTPTALTNEWGYNGVDGQFRLNADGTNERLLAVFQIRSSRSSRVVSPADTAFQNADTLFAPPPEEEPLETEAPDFQLTPAPEPPRPASESAD